MISSLRGPGAGSVGGRALLALRTSAARADGIAVGPGFPGPSALRVARFSAPVEVPT